jgi:hypothetical protein
LPPPGVPIDCPVAIILILASVDGVAGIDIVPLADVGFFRGLRRCDDDQRSNGRK